MLAKNGPQGPFFIVEPASKQHSSRPAQAQTADGPQAQVFRCGGTDSTLKINGSFFCE
ncbi:hypothetical protein [Comamonas thiooxydans]|uniref:hypothetical protein n=1 Tax=Comamonas thiooxydans TaxID=363952 RepID=UPI001C0F2BAA|nr:hypothetical protein [Comamonas thiooxydans]